MTSQADSGATAVYGGMGEMTFTFWSTIFLLLASSIVSSTADNKKGELGYIEEQSGIGKGLKAPRVEEVEVTEAASQIDTDVDLLSTLRYTPHLASRRSSK
jgi:hypothetical protein